MCGEPGVPDSRVSGLRSRACFRMAQPSLLRTAVPDQSARRLFCPAVFTYTRLTRWPHSYRQLSRDRRVMTRSIMRINHMLKSMGSLEQQKSYVVRTRKGERVHIFETPRGASADGPGDKYTLRDTWRLRLLLLKQLNAIVRAATENSEAPEPEAPTSPSFSAEGDLQEGAAAAAANSSPGSSFSSEAQQQGDSSHTIAYSNPSPTDRYIFYLHGGAFISQSPDFYRILLNGRLCTPNLGALSPMMLPVLCGFTSCLLAGGVPLFSVVGLQVGACWWFRECVYCWGCWRLQSSRGRQGPE